jgi:hypothetical protein
MLAQRHYLVDKFQQDRQLELMRLQDSIHLLYSNVCCQMPKHFQQHNNNRPNSYLIA